jgi:ubiquinone biosynthesis protein
MLQKTLLNIEGLGRDLYPKLDIWGVAKPELESILKEKYSVEHVARDLRQQLPMWIAQTPDMPNLIRDYLSKATSGELRTRIASDDLAQLRAEHAVSHRRTLGVLSAGAIGIAGALLTGLETGPWFIGGLSVLGLALLATSALIFFRSARR